MLLPGGTGDRQHPSCVIHCAGQKVCPLSGALLPPPDADSGKASLNNQALHPTQDRRGGNPALATREEAGMLEGAHGPKRDAPLMPSREDTHPRVAVSQQSAHRVT